MKLSSHTMLVPALQTFALLLPVNTSLVTAQSTAPRARAAYVMPNGSVQIVTAVPLAGAVQSLNALYITTHPGVNFSVLAGDNYSAMAALTFDRSAFAPLGTEYTRIGLGDNLKIAAEPIGIRIAHASLTPGKGVPSLGVIVNRANPITSLSMSQLTRIFTIGGPGGDIAQWGQAGVNGKLADRDVHPVGPLASDYLDSEDPQAGEFLSTEKMSGLNMNHNYVAMTRYADVVQRVSEDPAAVGITALNIPLESVKVVALKASDTSDALQPVSNVIASGRYPLDRYVYIYLRVGKGMPLDAFGREYVRMVLSPEGQRAIAAEGTGYIPLTAGEIAQELTKLDR